MVAAFIKTKALSQVVQGEVPFLVPVFCEQSVLTVQPRIPHLIAPALLESFNLARQTANAMLPAVDHSNGLFVKTALDTKTSVLTQVDDSVVLEACWFAHMHGAGGQGMIEQKLLDSLPAGAGKHDPKVALTSLQLVKRTPCCLLWLLRMRPP